MATATVHIENLTGFAGLARCYEIDPPYRGHGYVTIVVTPSYGQVVGPRADIFPATASGSSAEPSLKARGGSCNLHDEPDTTDRIEGAFAYALLGLGGYLIEVQDPS